VSAVCKEEAKNLNKENRCEEQEQRKGTGKGTRTGMLEYYHLDAETGLDFMADVVQERDEVVVVVQRADSVSGSSESP
jgi:hypothetical protein